MVLKRLKSDFWLIVKLWVNNEGKTVKNILRLVL